MQTTVQDESEYRTRRQRIDPRLAAAGWTVVTHDPATPSAHYAGHAVTEYPTDNGPADYALFVAGRLLGVVEAKKVTLGPQHALTQGERYAQWHLESVPEAVAQASSLVPPAEKSEQARTLALRNAAFWNRLLLSRLAHRKSLFLGRGFAVSPLCSAAPGRK